MGFFSKKDYVCEKCGKTFQKRINIRGNLCDECWQKDAREKFELEESIRGYVSYAREVLSKSYSSDEMRQIISRRDTILEQCKQDCGITRAELQNASDNYKKLTDEQAADVLVRVANSSLSSTIGAGSGENFFVPTAFDKMIVDAADVFAVGYTSDHRLEGGSNEVILCAVFTNDPYVPVFPMVYIGKKELFSFNKSKQGRASVNALFETMCPNLKYTVGDVKQLKKQIKQDAAVRGNIDLKFMLDQISNVAAGKGIFDTEKMHSDLYEGTKNMLDEIGYILEDDINSILRMDKMFNRNYWNKQLNKL